MTLPELAIQRPVTTIVVLVSIVVLGAIAVTRLPLAFLPDFEEPHLWVVVEYPGASSKTIERTILRPLEEALGSIQGVRHMWSRCDEASARVSLNFDWGTNMKLKRVEVREKLDRSRSTLPDDVERIDIGGDWDVRDTGEQIIEARISSGRDLSRGYELLDRKIVKPLERIPGVAIVRLDGVNPREVRVNLKVAELTRHGVDPRQNLRSLLDNNVDRSLGTIRGDDRTLMIRAVGALRTVPEIEDLIVSDWGTRLGDVAEVTYQEPPLEYGRHLDGQFALGITVSKESSGNTVEISREVKRRIEEMAQDPELEGINFLVWEDQGEEILKTMVDLRNSGILGGILASGILFLFLRRVSATAVAVVCIPFSLIFACGIIWAQGKTLNTITLLGLIVGIGMLVDNAVVVMENIARHEENGVPRRKAARIGSREVAVAVTAATLTSVIVFLPIIFSRPSEMNIYLKELGLTVSYTLLASLFISQTLIPLAMARFISAKKKSPTAGLLERIGGRYERVLDFALHHRWVAPAIGLTVVGSGVWPFLKIDKNFDVNNTEMFIGISYNISEPLSLERKQELVTNVESLLEPHRDRLHVRSLYSFWSNDWVMTRLYMKDGYANEEAMNRVRMELREIVPRIAGVRLEVQDNIPFWMRDRGKRVAFQLTGEDTEVLSDLAIEARKKLEKIDGLFDFYTTAEGGKLEVQTRLDRDRARTYGVTPDQPSDVVELTFRGRRLPKFKGPDGEVDMRLMLDERKTGSLDQLHNLSLVQASGSAIPLASVADFAVVKGPEEIVRDNRVTGVWVGARYDQGVKEEYIEKAKKLLDEVDLPYGYAWENSPFQLQRHESQTEFITNLLLALGLIFAVMAGLFESVRQAISLMVSLPFAVAGAAWTLYLCGVDFDQPASVGLFLLLGTVVNNGIVMIEHINMYRRQGMERRLAMLRGGRERLRPILMTTATTLLGLLPIVIQKPSLAGVYYYSMALVIMGGLAVATVLTMILLPTTVCITEDSLGWAGRKVEWFPRWIRARAGGARGNTRLE
jgi:HAE1 family hydrophobic/amphiphilic exporter-1